MQGPLGAGVFSVIGILVYGVVLLAVIAAIVLVAILLIRFLLVGTKAAKLYIAQHETAAAAAAAAAAVTDSTPVEPPATDAPE